MEEAIQVVAEAVAAEESTPAATASSSSLPSGDGGDSHEQAPTTKKTATKKRDAVPRVRRRVVKDIVWDEPKVVEINAGFFVQLGRTLRTVERESRQRRLSALPIV